MARFRVGDLVEYVGPMLNGKASLLDGMEATVIKVSCNFTDSLGRKRDDGIVTTLSDKDHYTPPERLRLRRPPSWDQWITDTRDVERECKREAQLEQLQKLVDASPRR